jgi:DUF1365 family protein
MESFLYEGTLRHRRFTAPSRDFEYALFMAYLDLGELETVFRGRWLWSARAPSVAWFRRADHYGDPRIPLDEAIRRLVVERTGTRPAGPIRLLTHLRYLGHCFNPVSFYYCFARDGRAVETIVAEVNNTPWGERHMYVLAEADLRSDVGPMAALRSAASKLGPGDAKHYELKKAFHVSPFLAMDMDYGWSFGTPGEQLWVHMENTQKGVRVFEATLSLRKRTMSGLECARALALRPAMTVQVVVAIYVQALSLWWGRAKFYPHPRTPAPKAS